MRIDGNIATGGGGLPRADIALSQPRGGGPMSGEARIAPYAAGGARLALAPVRVPRPRATARPRSTTVALLDGPFPGGRVTGLRIPIERPLRRAGRRLRLRPRLHRRALPVAAPRARCGSARRGCRCARPARRSSTKARHGTGPGRRRQPATCGSPGGSGSSPFALTAVASAAARQRPVRRDRPGDPAWARPTAPVLINAAGFGGSLGGGGVTGDFAGARGDDRAGAAEAQRGRRATGDFRRRRAGDRRRRRPSPTWPPTRASIRCAATTSNSGSPTT